MSWRLFSNRVLLFALLLIVGLSVVIYLSGRWVKASMTQQLLRQHQTLVRAEASNITSFFQVFGDSIAVLAQLGSMEQWDTETVRDMDAFVEQWRDSGLVGGVVLIDKKGIVRLNSNILGTSDVGASLADRDYFTWTKSLPEEGEYFVGEPVAFRLGATKSQIIVPVASPVYQKGVFVGVLVASVKLYPLTEAYLELMKISDQTDVYLINERGDLLYGSHAQDKVGTNIFDLLQIPQNVLNTTEEGNLQLSFLDPKSGKSEEHLVAYSPILLGSQNWVLIMASPTQDVSNFTKPIYVRQTAILLLVSLTILLFGLIVARENQIKRD